MNNSGIQGFFAHKSNLITYGLIALAYVLVIALFITVLTQNGPPQENTMASKADLQGMNSSVSDLSTRMKQVERDIKKAMTCETGWQKFQDSCYYFTSKYNWMKARSTCVSRHADLVVITSDEEQKFVSGHTGSMPYWIGLSDIEEEGKWTWVDGTDYASSYKSWMPNEPNDENNEDCAYLTNGNWNDKKCTHSDFFAVYRFFTQKSNLITYGLIALSYVLIIALLITVLTQNGPLQTNTMASKADLQGLNSSVSDLSTRMKLVERDAKKATTCETGWQKFQDSCYYFTSVKSNWMKARSTCISKHADLAVITSDEEQKFVSRQTGSIPHWIGLNDIEEEGKWTWVDGTDYTSSYKSWMPGEPNDTENNEDCAHLWDGRWNDKKCTHSDFMALCEKKLGV
ncbi:C-type mannose receptor 2-like [Mantella aurantiaca]